MLVFWISLAKAVIDAVMSGLSLRQGHDGLALLFFGYVIADVAGGLLSVGPR